MYDVHSPFDDDEEERQRRAIEALSRSAEPPPMAAAQPPAYDLTPPEPEAGPPEEQAPIAALSREASPPPMAAAPEGGGGDDGGPGLNGWAIAADLVFNRGRGLGGIIGMAEQQKRDHLRSKAMAGNRSQDLANKDRAHALESRRLSYLEGIEGRKGLPQPLSESDKLARERFEAEKAERDIDNKRADSELELHKQRLAKQGEGGGLTPYQQYSIDRNKTLDKQRDEDRDEARGNKKAHDDAQLANQYSTKTEKARASAASLKEIDAIIKKHGGKNVPGLGAVESVTPDWMRALKKGYYEWQNDGEGLQGISDEEQRMKDAQTVSDALTNLSQSVLRKETGAVAAPREEDLTKIRTGSGKGRTEEQAMEALRLMRDLTYGDLRAYSSGREDIARNVIELSKLDADEIFGPRAQAAQPPPAAAPQAAPLAVAPPPPARVANPMTDDFSDFKPDENKLSVIDDDEVLKGLGITRKGNRR